jgi:hypothetical protein
MVDYKADSFIKKTSLVDEYFLDINQLPVFPETISDEEFVVTAEFDERPDLLAYKLYGSPRLFWVFALRNLDVISDPIRDFKPGLVIMLPSTETVNRYAS